MRFRINEQAFALGEAAEVKDSEYSEGLWHGFLKQRATGRRSETTDGKDRSQTGQRLNLVMEPERQSE